MSRRLGIRQPRLENAGGFGGPAYRPGDAIARTRFIVQPSTNLRFADPRGDRRRVS